MQILTERPHGLDPALQCVTVVSVPFEQNTYILWLTGQNACVVVDPGLQPAGIIEAINEAKLLPAAILLTHGHADHIGGNAALKAQWPACPIVIGVNDEEKLADPRKNLSALFGMQLRSPPADRLVRHGEQFDAAGITWDVAEIPGHSRGHVVFIARQFRPTLVVGGDVLFAGSIGRTDFPDGDAEQLLAGIRAHLFTLPDDTLVLTGHGDPTTTGQEKRDNPYVGRRAGI